MKKIYFDITDIVEYARNHNQVSGIQRVQARVIASLARKYGGNEVVCTYWNYAKSCYFQVPADGVFTSGEFDPGELLYKLDAVKSYWLLDKGEVRSYLQKYNHRKVYRGLKKVALYANALVHPEKMQKQGFKVRPKRLGVKTLPAAPLKKISTKDVLVFLGANWSDSDLLKLGRDHRREGGAVVQMIYDLIPYVEPQYFTSGLVDAYTRFLTSTPEYVSGFACISDWTKRDLQGFLSTVDNYQPVVRTTPLAHEFAGFARNEANTNPADMTLSAQLSDKPFVLCVGTVEIRKNGANLLRAWRLLMNQLGVHAPRLVFAGKYGWKLTEFMSIIDADPELGANVTVVQGPSDQDLAYLYQKSLFSVYPSFYEGWGLPVGEAAWFGKYCLASSATSIPEVCHDLIDYVAPDDVAGMAAKLVELISNPNMIAVREKALQVAPLRTWSDVADNLYEYLQKDFISL
jgi:glycosyltransferase involved in cell wall biosynthesis